RDLYAEKLQKEGVIDKNYVKKIEKEYKSELEKYYESSHKEETAEVKPIMQDDWEDLTYGDEKDMLEPVDTTFDLDELTDIAEKVTTLPENLDFIRKVH